MIVNELSARRWLSEQPECDSAALEKLKLFASLLEAENNRQNLVARTSMPFLWQRHIADSAQLLAHVPRGTHGSWLDLGTGAGFPGIVTAVLRPDLQVTMVESRARRIEWLNRVIEALELDNGRVEGSRLEQVTAPAQSFISARAFASLPRLLALSARFSTSATLWLLPKGRSAAQELETLRGWNHTFRVERSLTDPEAGIVVGTLAGRKG